jgi:hypothetical protein
VSDMELDWGQFVDKVMDGNIPMIPELTQGYVLPPVPDPFARLRGVGNTGGVSASTAKDYLNQYINYVELLSIVNRSFAGAPIQEQYKTLKHFVEQGANVDDILKDTGIAIVCCEPPSKALNGEKVIGLWDAKHMKIHDAENERDVDRFLIRGCKLAEMKVEQLKNLSKIVGLDRAYKLKKAELVAALESL